MPDSTPILALPFLVPNQAQPYVTHNEALRRLDILVQLSVAQFGAETPPAVPDEGDLYALGAAPTGTWAGQPQALAAWIDGAWLFLAPQQGWRAWGRAEAELRVWDGAGWIKPPAELDNVAGLGIGTASDAVNRLAVKSEATLLSHDGAGHQLKINKAAGTDTASLLFQSNWTGHAEIGLAGDTDFSIKVSPDGSAWTEALAFDASTGEASGAAVQASATDTTAGRIPKMANQAKFSDLFLEDSSPILDLQNTGDASTHARSRVLRGSDLFAFATRADDGSAVSFDYEATVGAAGVTEHKWNIEGAQAAVISSGGNMSIGGTSTPARLYAEGDGTTGGSDDIIQGRATNASFGRRIFYAQAVRTASPDFDFLLAQSDTGGSVDAEFRLSGDGNGTCDGSWTGGGADYAEYFEWGDGNPDGEDRVGMAVVLDGDKIRPARTGETPVGVISGTPSVVGDGDIDRWKGKYLRDDFGRYIQADYEAVEWTAQGDAGEVRHSYAADAVPEGVTVPADATRTPQQRRKLNPEYTPTQPYIRRAERPEWDMVGLIGKLRLRKGQPVAPTWIRMRDVSAAVEEWLVR